MKKLTVAGIALAVMASAVLAMGGTGSMKLKAGEEVYTCACGEKCPCDTMSQKGGKCACSNEVKHMKKGMVKKSAQGKAVVSVDEKDKTMSTTGKYVCSCGAECKCGTISQIPGKCPCGKELKKAGS